MRIEDYASLLAVRMIDIAVTLQVVNGRISGGLMMRVVTLAVFSVALSSMLHAEDEPERVPLIRFYNEGVNEHAYSSDEAEAGAWRVVPKLKEQKMIGMVSATELPGTVRLWRAVRNKDRKHFYYTQAPKGAAPMTAETKEFSVYVWKKPGDGRIPIYGSTWIDHTDVYFDTDMKAVKKYASDTKKALNVERIPLGQTPVFYIYPPPTEPANSEAKPK